MNIKKFLAMFLSVIMILTMAISVSAEVQYSNVPTAMPEPVTDAEGNVIDFAMDENFNSLTTDDIPSITYDKTNNSTGILAKSTNHTATITEDGALNLSFEGTKDTSIISTLLFGNHGITDNLVVEFDAIRYNLGQVMFCLTTQNTNGSKYLATRTTFVEENVYVTTTFPTTYNTNEKGNQITPYTSVTYPQNLHIIMELTDDNTWSLWVNGERWVDNESVYGTQKSDGTAATVKPSSIKGLAIRTQSKNANVSIDNLKVYQSKKRIEGKAEYTGELVAEGALNTSVKMIDLPESKTIGAAILAIYNETDGAKSLADVKLVANPELTDGAFTIGIDSLAENVTADSELKLFIFEGAGNIVPITLPVEVKAQ